MGYAEKLGNLRGLQQRMCCIEQVKEKGSGPHMLNNSVGNLRNEIVDFHCTKTGCDESVFAAKWHKYSH